MERFRSLNPSRDAAGRATGGGPEAGLADRRVTGGGTGGTAAKAHRDHPPALPPPLALALEPRMMFDAAGLATAGAADGGGEPAPPPAEDGGTAAAGDDADSAGDDGSDGTDPALDDALAAHVPPAGRSEVVFVDTAVEDWQTLVGALDADAEVVLLDDASPALSQIAGALGDRSGIDAIHIVSHGDVGRLAFGSGTVDATNLDAFAGDLETIGAALTDSGDILLYGCSVGADGGGQAFLDRLAEATAADVAASDDLTGADDLGGDWTLEASVGRIDATAIDDAFAASGFAGVLTPADQNFDGLANQTVDDGILTAGDWSVQWSQDGTARTSGNFGSFIITDSSTATDLDNGGASDKVLDALGDFGEADAAVFTSTNGNFKLDSFRISLGVFGETNLTIEGLNGTTVVGTQTVTLVNGAPGENPGQLVSFSGADWQNLTAFRIRTTSGTDDIGFFLDDLVASDPVVNQSPTVTATGGSAAFTEGGGAIAADTGLTVSDNEGDNITGATVQITSNYQNGADVLAVTDGSGITSSWDAATGTLTLTGTTTAASYQTVLRTLTFGNSSDAPSTATRTLTYSVTDAGSGSAGTATRDVAVTGVNDVPTVANLDGDSFTYTEGDGATDLDVGNDATVGDPDSTDFNGGSVTIAYQSGQQTEDRLVIDTSGTVSLSAGQTAGSTVSVGGSAIGTIQAGATGGAGEDLTITFNSANATPAAVQSLMRAIQYDNAAGDDPTDGNRVVRVTVSDGDGGTSTASDVTINVDPVNDAPAVTASGGTTAFTEDGGAVTVDGGVTLGDADTATLSTATVSITANFQSGADVLAFTNTNATTFGNIAASYDAGTGVLTLTSAGATATVAQFQNALRAVTYDNTSQTPTTGDRTIAFTANDGTADSAAATKTVSVEAVNDAPAFGGLDGTPSFTEGGTSVLLDGDVTISDAELGALNGGNGNFAGAGLTIARNGGADANDRLSVQSGGALTVAGGPAGGGTITAGGNVIATIANTGDGQIQITFADNGTVPTTALVNEVMQAIGYANAGDDPAATVQLDWTFSDGNAGDAQGTGANPGTASGSVSVSITAVDDAPTLTATGSNPTYTEGGAAPGADLFSSVAASTVESAQTFTSLTLTVTNVSDGAAEILRFDGSDVALTDGNSVATATNGLTVDVAVAGGTATVSFSGAALGAAALQTLVDGLAYRNTSDTPTTGSNRVVTITQVTDSGSSTGANENAAALSIASTVSLTAVNDPPVVGGVFGDTGSQVVAGSGAQDVTGLDDATVGNADSADYNGGFLTIGQGGGTANGSWGLDGAAATSGGDGTVAAGETVSVGGVAIGTVNATDDGQGGNALRIDFNSANATSARIQTLLRALTYDAPSGLGDRTFTLTLNDADGTANGGDEDASGSFQITVSPNPPVVGNLDGDSVATANGVAVRVDQGGNATVTDADSADFDGGNLTVTRTSGLSGNFSLDGVAATSGGDGTIAAGETIAVGGTAIATVTTDGQGGNDLVLTFNSADATPARVQTLIRALQYGSTSGGAHTFTAAVTDAGSNAATSAAAAFTVNVEAAPVNTVPGAQTAVDGTATAIAGISVADADSATVTTTVSVPAGAGSFATTGPATITGGGTNAIQISGAIADVNATLANLQYTPAVNASGTQTITVLTSDGTNSDTDTIAVTVSDRPTLGNLAGDTATFTEDGGPVRLDAGGDATVQDADSADFDGGALTVSVTGGGVAAEDVLSVVNEGTGAGQIGLAGGTVTFGGTAIGTAAGGTGGADLVVTLNANATPAATQALIRALTYANSGGDSPTPGTRAITVGLTDGAGGTSSGPQALSVTVAGVNDAPTIAAPTTLTVTEDTATAVTGITVADVDAGTGAVTATLTAGSGTLSAAAGGGVTVSGGGTATLTLTGATTAINAFIAGANVIYTPAANAEADTTLTVQVNDNGNTGGAPRSSTVATVALDLLPVNDAPLPAGTVAPIVVTPGQPVTTTLDATLFSDVDQGDTLTLSLTAADGGPLPSWATYDAATGTLGLDPPSTLTGTVPLRLVATDGSGATATQSVAVQVVAAQGGVPEFRAAPPVPPLSVSDPATPVDPPPVEPPPPAPVPTPIGGSGGDTPGTTRIARFFDAGLAGRPLTMLGQTFQQAALQATGTSGLANAFGSGGGQLFSFGGGGWTGYGLQTLGLGGGGNPAPDPAEPPAPAAPAGTGASPDGPPADTPQSDAPPPNGPPPNGPPPNGPPPGAPSPDGAPPSGDPAPDGAPSGGAAPGDPATAPEAPDNAAAADDAARGMPLDPVALALLDGGPLGDAPGAAHDLVDAGPGAAFPSTADATGAPGFRAQLSTAAFGFEHEAAATARALAAAPVA